MGNLADDTTIEATSTAGRYAAAFHPDWEIWGPNGGYVAAVALRAAGAHTDLPRPASLLCHYLGVGKFAPVDIEVTTLRRAKRAESLRVSITQEGQAIAEALVWCIADGLDGLDHDVTAMPQAATKTDPRQLKPITELNPEGAKSPFSFGRNFEQRPIDWMPFEEWESREDLDGTVLTWMRYQPQSTFEDDAFVDAARSVVLLDTYQWPAACNAYRPGTMHYQAPSLDLAVSFHEIDPTSEWLLVDARSPRARDGLVAGQASIWSERGKLLASGGQQMLCRPMRAVPA
ncbi:MAG: acyl-CoA thioesterase [Actinomycetota bacterium]|jgi:acyl-CoA thioesterase II|nr:acyl-CoA thioesterase [Actinomycetota bacterium]